MQNSHGSSGMERSYTHYDQNCPEDLGENLSTTFATLTTHAGAVPAVGIISENGSFAILAFSIC